MNTTMMIADRVSRGLRRLLGALLLNTVFVTWADALELTSKVSIVVPEDTPAAVRLALADVQRDCEKILGAKLTEVATPPPWDGPFVALLTPGFSPDELADGAVTGREAHAVRRLEWNGRSVLALQGGDTRGLIYALYTFSEEVLGVPPLWFYTGWQPTRRERIVVPDAFRVAYGAPEVRWRAWFQNDTDFLEAWHERSAENHDAMFEAMLRLKLNTVEGYTTSGGVALDGAKPLARAASSSVNSYLPPHALHPLAARAAARGMVFSNTHTVACGAHPGVWEVFWRTVRGVEPPPLRVADVKSLETFWRWHLEFARKHGLETIPNIGFRGAGDRGFWIDYEDAPADEIGRARVVREMLDRQIALIREVTGEANPVMRITIYDELSDMVAAGHLKLPDVPNLIVTFPSTRRDHFPPAAARAHRFVSGQMTGYYLNFQFTGTGSHLAAGEDFWKMEANYRWIGDLIGRAPEFSVVNIGNVREHVLEGAANARMLWSYAGYASDAWLKETCAKHVGNDHAEETAALFRGFYDAYWRQRRPELPGFARQYLFYDLRHARAITDLAKAIRAGKRDPEPLRKPAWVVSLADDFYRIDPAFGGHRDQLEAVVHGTGAARERFAKVATAAAELERRVPPGRKRFVHDYLWLHARFMEEASAAVHHLARALDQVEDAKRRGDEVRSAAEALERMVKLQADGEREPWVGWYEHDSKFDVRARLAEVRALSDGERR